MTTESTTPTMADVLEAVLLFHDDATYTDERAAEWKRLTGAQMMTERNLLDTARRAVKEGK